MYLGPRKRIQEQEHEQISPVNKELKRIKTPEGSECLVKRQTGPYTSKSCASGNMTMLDHNG